VQVIGTAGALKLAGLDELVGHGDDVGRLAVRVQREDRLEDQLVLWHVEVGAAQRLDDIGDRVLRQQHAAQGALLCQQVVRRGALGPPLLAGSAQTFVGDIRDRHAAPLFPGPGASFSGPNATLETGSDTRKPACG
jgi:hypothetical protein